MTEAPRQPKDRRSRFRVLIEDRDGRLFVAFLVWIVSFALADFLFEKANQPVLSSLMFIANAFVGLYIGLSRLIAPRPPRWWWAGGPLLTRLSGLLFLGFSLMVGGNAIQRLLTSFQ